MEILVDKRKKKGVIAATVTAIALSVTIGACGVYVNDYYRADSAEIAAFAKESAYTAIEKRVDGNRTVYAPKSAKAGLIFYPGGKVEHTAYEPLMLACAKEGILCVLIEMPFRLAVLDQNAAEGVQEGYAEIDCWYVGGHSLGGSMAASYVEKHTAEFDGLVLLAAYSTADLSGSGLDVLSIYGSEDKVMNTKKYEKYKGNLPVGFTEYVIGGGCHAYFGMYGRQDGDGEPRMNARKQILLTAEKIAESVEKTANR